jgi:hypothetical protein
MGLLSWWGMTDPMGSGLYEAPLKRLNDFVAQMQGAYGTAYRRQMETFFAANEHCARAFQEMMRSRQPGDVMKAESELVSALMEEAAAQAKTWNELVATLTRSYAVAASGQTPAPAAAASETASTNEAAPAAEADPAAEPQPERAARNKHLKAV